MDTFNYSTRCDHFGCINESARMNPYPICIHCLLDTCPNHSHITYFGKNDQVKCVCIECHNNGLDE